MTKLSATLAVVRRLVLDLGDTLHAEAPTVARVFGRGARLDAVANDSQVVYQHARLMKAAEELEIDLLMAMPRLSARLVSQASASRPTCKGRLASTR